MNVIVKLFGNEARTAARREVALELPGDSATAAEVRTALAREVPALATAAGGDISARLAVNHEFADGATPVYPGDEVALIGQVSGG